MGSMRNAVAAAVLLVGLTLAGCATGSGYTPAPEPPVSRESTATATETAAPPAETWAASPEFPVCVDLYASIEGASDDPERTCLDLVLAATPSALSAQFSDQLQVDFLREELLAEFDPIEPHYVLSFSGAGEATVTWFAGTGMIQRTVQLPYSEQIPVPKYVNSNVVQIPAGSGVGCAITSFSNDDRDGFVLVEVAAVAGQTMAMCAPD